MECFLGSACTHRQPPAKPREIHTLPASARRCKHWRGCAEGVRERRACAAPHHSPKVPQGQALQNPLFEPWSPGHIAVVRPSSGIFQLICDAFTLQVFWMHTASALHFLLMVQLVKACCATSPVGLLPCPGPVDGSALCLSAPRMVRCTA